MPRLRSERGFLTIELVIAIAVLSIAILALMAAWDQAFFSLRSSAKTSSAGLLAENQLELYASLPYDSIGLDTATLASVQANDETYAADESALPESGTDVTISGCGSSPQCSPVQTLTGSDHHSYELETFIRLLANPSSAGRMEKVVTVIVREAAKAGSPTVLTMQTGFDAGPPT